jgi:hypothetical protein
MRTNRDRVLTICAILFGLLAFSDLMKPVPVGDPEQGLVFFGRRLSGTPNAVIGPLFGLYLLVYAIGIWRMRRWAFPMGIVYAAYVVVNLFLFTLRDPNPTAHGVAFNVVYGTVATTVSAGTAWLLARRRATLT